MEKEIVGKSYNPEKNATYTYYGDGSFDAEPGDTTATVVVDTPVVDTPVVDTPVVDTPSIEEEVPDITIQTDSN